MLQNVKITRVNDIRAGPPRAAGALVGHYASDCRAPAAPAGSAWQASPKLGCICCFFNYLKQWFASYLVLQASYCRAPAEPRCGFGIPWVGKCLFCCSVCVSFIRQLNCGRPRRRVDTCSTAAFWKDSDAHRDLFIPGCAHCELARLCCLCRGCVSQARAVLCVA